MNELALCLFLVALAALAGYFARRTEDRVAALWLWGWIPLIASGVCVLLGPRLPGSEAVVHLLSPFLPALLLAGTLALIGREWTRPLLLLAVGIGGLRWLLASTGYGEVSLGLGLATEPTAELAAAWLAARLARSPEGTPACWRLVPAFIAVAVMDGSSAVAGLLGAPAARPVLLGWLILGPLALGAQLNVAMGRAEHQRRRWEEHVEEVLTVSQDRFRALTENAFDLIAELETDGSFTYNNPRYETLLGYLPEGLLGRQAIELVHPEDRERVLLWSRGRMLNRPGPSFVRLRALHRDGNARWLECSARPFETAEGERRLVVMSRDLTDQRELENSLRHARDELELRVAERTTQLNDAVEQLRSEIDERRQIELELRLSQERYRTVSELSSDLSYSMRVAEDGSLERDWVTQAFRRITGYEPEEIEEQGWLSFVHPDDVETTASSLQAAARGETREFESRIVTRSGETRWLRARVTGVVSEADGDRRILGAVRDVTEQKRSEEERHQLDEHMQQVQRLESLGVLAGGIAHDFNNLVVVILGNVSLLRAEHPDDTLALQRLDRIRAAARHAESLTSQMLTYSGRVSIKRSPLHLSILVEEMEELLEASIPKNVRLETRLAPSLPLFEGGATQIRQIVMNLVTNAAESYDGEPGEVVVRTGRMLAGAGYLANSFGDPDPLVKNYVFIDVADSGCGMSADTCRRIFEPFFTTRFTGRGLGLAAVLGIVRGHRGAIKLDSRAGHGTRFRVLLPAFEVGLGT